MEYRIRDGDPAASFPYFPVGELCNTAPRYGSAANTIRIMSYDAGIEKRYIIKPAVMLLVLFY